MINICIVVEGGVVQSVISNQPGQVRAFILDYDVEGEDAHRLTEIPQPAGGTALACYNETDVSLPDIKLPGWQS